MVNLNKDFYPKVKKKFYFKKRKCRVCGKNFTGTGFLLYDKIVVKNVFIDIYYPKTYMCKNCGIDKTFAAIKYRHKVWEIQEDEERL